MQRKNLTRGNIRQYPIRATGVGVEVNYAVLYGMVDKAPIVVYDAGGVPIYSDDDGDLDAAVIAISQYLATIESGWQVVATDSVVDSIRIIDTTVDAQTDALDFVNTWISISSNGQLVTPQILDTQLIIDSYRHVVDIQEPCLVFGIYDVRNGFVKNCKLVDGGITHEAGAAMFIADPNEWLINPLHLLPAREYQCNFDDLPVGFLGNDNIRGGHAILFVYEFPRQIHPVSQG